MTLLISTIAAIVCTGIWYFKDNKNEKLIGTESLIFWGASIMWFVDFIFEYIEDGVEVFAPSVKDMINDTFLGLSVVVLGFVIWLVMLLIKDPKGVFRKN